MPRILYVAKLAVDKDSGLPLPALEGQTVTIVRRGTTTPAAISEDEAGTLLIPGSTRTVSPNLFIPSFWVDAAEGPVSALGGGTEVPLESVEGLSWMAAGLVASASAAAASAADAADAAAAAGGGLPAGGQPGQYLVRGASERTGSWTSSSPGGGTSIEGAPSQWPQTFPASPHNHTLSEVELLGWIRELLGSSDTQTFRTRIGAGTGNGTSNLTLGTAGTQAAPGNHAHAAANVAFTPTGSVTATNVQDAVAQAAQLGGGGGTVSNAVYVWKQSSGAYPALPSSKPAGVEAVAAYGAQSPISLSAAIPSWIGAGPGKASLTYDYNPTLT